ncbi:hypothetical protein BC629DRAFT_1434237 [Irpex lacteus]|nr:hypothetical protein BC629DRAFT_1434237 [Irpex lacteus]
MGATKSHYNIGNALMVLHTRYSTTIKPRRSSEIEGSHNYYGEKPREHQSREIFSETHAHCACPPGPPQPACRGSEKVRFYRSSGVVDAPPSGRPALGYYAVIVREGRSLGRSTTLCTPTPGARLALVSLSPACQGPSLVGKFTAAGRKPFFVVPFGGVVKIAKIIGEFDATEMKNGEEKAWWPNWPNTSVRAVEEEVDREYFSNISLSWAHKTKFVRLAYGRSGLDVLNIHHRLHVPEHGVATHVVYYSSGNIDNHHRRSNAFSYVTLELPYYNDDKTLQSSTIPYYDGRIVCVGCRARLTRASCLWLKRMLRTYDPIKSLHGSTWTNFPLHPVFRRKPPRALFPRVCTCKTHTYTLRSQHGCLVCIDPQEQVRKIRAKHKRQDSLWYDIMIMHLVLSSHLLLIDQLTRCPRLLRYAPVGVTPTSTITAARNALRRDDKIPNRNKAAITILSSRLPPPVLSLNRVLSSKYDPTLPASSVLVTTAIKNNSTLITAYKRYEYANTASQQFK